MSQWAFVIAAYAVAILATAGLIIQSLLSMRRAEAEAKKVRDRR